jgi:hypothetical protein
MSPNAWFSQPVYLRGGDPEAVNEPSLLYPGQLGIRFSVIDPSRADPSNTTGEGTAKAYKLVGTDSSMSVAPYDGAVAWWQDQANYKVTTAATNRGRIAGVFRTVVTPGNYTCIQQTGLGKVKLTDASANGTAAGESVIPSATAGKAQVETAGTAPTYPSLGQAIGMYNIPAREALVNLVVPEVL